MIRIFIGFDERETVAWHVLCHSILARSSQPVSFVPLALNNLGPLMWRDRNALQSTDFSFSRFLTPYLSGYEGWSIFMDCDMLVLDDIAKLWALRDDRFAVMCVKHDHRPVETTKFLDKPQTAYGKKNWSSVMLFNNARCTALSADYVNTATGLELHQFKWLSDDSQIGELPSTAGIIWWVTTHRAPTWPMRTSPSVDPISRPMKRVSLPASGSWNTRRWFA